MRLSTKEQEIRDLQVCKYIRTLIITPPLGTSDWFEEQYIPTYKATCWFTIRSFCKHISFYSVLAWAVYRFIDADTYIQRLKDELKNTEKKLKQVQEDLEAQKFTSNSITGKKLMAKCRALQACWMCVRSAVVTVWLLCWRLTRGRMKMKSLVDSCQKVKYTSLLLRQLYRRNMLVLIYFVVGL